jgi:hypothetical protein
MPFGRSASTPVESSKVSSPPTYQSSSRASSSWSSTCRTPGCSGSRCHLCVSESRDRKMVADHKGGEHQSGMRPIFTAPIFHNHRSANVVISIVNSGGHAVMLQRLDGSHLAAIGKARPAPRSSFAGRPRRPARAQSVRARAQEVHRSPLTIPPPSLSVLNDTCRRWATSSFEPPS